MMLGSIVYCMHVTGLDGSPVRGMTRGVREDDAEVNCVIGVTFPDAS